MNKNETAQDIISKTKDILWRKYGVKSADAGSFQLYYSLSVATRHVLEERYQNYKNEAERQSVKRICYLSMEFLVGKSLKNNLFNLGVYSEITEYIRECSFSEEEIFSIEKDAGLGNGGLGRLAACYLDAMAGGSYRGEGYSILYEYGIFKQTIKEGDQIELPDCWLDTGEAWISKSNEKKYVIKLGGNIITNGKTKKYVNYSEVYARGYDMFFPGYKNAGVSLLRLWKAEQSNKIDMSWLNDGDYDSIMNKRNASEIISLFLYPADNTEEGKRLRLVQQYFFVSATVQSVVAEHYKCYKNVENIADHVCFHINDTHPALCIPELIRVLSNDYSVSFEKALSIVNECVSYTNHTVLPEALEEWDEKTVKELIPPIYEILKAINDRMSSDIYGMCASSWERASKISIISGSKIRMANLAVKCSGRVNGVSELHSGILKDRLFKDFAQKEPEKFTNVTNAITYRRWLCQANPALSSLLDLTIGTEYREKPYELSNLIKYSNDKDFLDKFEAVRYENKKRLSNVAKRLVGELLDPDSMFDIQAKRLHEYKRQLMNVLKILTYYVELHINPNADISPKTFIFAAKAAPSYYHAKRIIKLINKISEMIKKNPKVKDVLNVVFLPDYSVSLAELIVPAADLSEQISLAGKEASGTGNMKFMLNGALTIGTFDGANIEICDLVGEDNAYIFGMRVDEVNKTVNEGVSNEQLIRSDPRLSEVISLLKNDICGECFSDIADYLCGKGDSDPFYCIKDYSSYMQCYRRACIDYHNKRKFFSKATVNVSHSGFFSSDRAIEEYAERIWKAKKVNVF